MIDICVAAIYVLDPLRSDFNVDVEYARRCNAWVAWERLQAGLEPRELKLRPWPVVFRNRKMDSVVVCLFACLLTSSEWVGAVDD